MIYRKVLWIRTHESHTVTTFMASHMQNKLKSIAHDGMCITLFPSCLIISININLNNWYDILYKGLIFALISKYISRIMISDIWGLFVKETLYFLFFYSVDEFLLLLLTPPLCSVTPVSPISVLFTIFVTFLIIAVCTQVKFKRIIHFKNSHILSIIFPPCV